VDGSDSEDEYEYLIMKVCGHQCAHHLFLSLLLFVCPGERRA